ncbi:MULTISPECIES: hypothetical protein [unclassified Arthrobacter]|uniref:hypothetical protein n=1 Tax=unclassified Arthrobacter TaxID=235627 RepID=UPI00149188DD|nr:MULTISPECIES: hypothetical protein [unclassified Arthrobacter]NOJ63907.1 hypothetical protein [Arthrobacter sp. 147(2020)]
MLKLATEARRYVSADGFGHDGAGGQVSFAEPELGLSIAFVTNWMEAGDDQRETRIVNALRNVVLGLRDAYGAFWKQYGCSERLFS